MTRKSRAHRIKAEAPNHIVLRGNNRRTLFSSTEDRLRFCAYLERAMKRTETKLYHLALLSNHVHLVLEPVSVLAVSSCIKLCSQSYAAFRNKRTQGSGKLFEQRFWSHPIETSRYMAVVAAYVDLNPEHAGVGPRYRSWSTYAIHAGETCKHHIIARLWSASPWYLSLGDSVEERQRRFKHWSELYRKHAQRLRARYRLTEPTSSHRGALPRRPNGGRAT